MATSCRRWPSSSRRCATRSPPSAARSTTGPARWSSRRACRATCWPPTRSSSRRERRAEVAAKLVELLGLEGEAADKLTARMTSEKEYVVLARDLEPAISDRIRAMSAGKDPELSGLILEPQQVRLYPQAGGGPDTTLAAHLLGFVNREGAGQYGVEQYYQDDLAGMKTRGRRPARRLGQRGPGHLHGARGGLPGPEPHAHDRRVAPGRGGAGAPVGLDRRPRQARVRGGDGPLHGRGRRLRELPLVRRQRLPGHRGRGPRRLRRPDRVHGLRARLRVQDDDRHRRAGRRDGDHEVEDQGHRDAAARRRPRPGRRRRPQGDGRDDLRGRDRLLAQRGRRQGRPQAPQDT